MLIRRIAVLALLLPFSLLANAAQSSPAHKAQLEKDVREIQSNTLTLDTVSRALQTLHEISEAVDADPALREKKKDDDTEQEKTLDQMGALIASSPKLVAIISSHGFTPRALMLAQFTMLQTALAIISLDAGATLQDAIGEAHVNPANIKLFREHKAEIDALQLKYPVRSTD